MQDTFERLIKSLGKLLNASLHVDANQSCTLLIEEKITVQIEKDHQEKGYIIGAMVATLPPGKFREEVLKNALQANHFFPKMGTFGYSAHNNQLALFYLVKDPDISAEKFAEVLSAFVAKALEWKQALEQNQSAPSSFMDQSEPVKPPPFPFKS